MNLWWFIIKGGPIMVPIILGSIIGLALILERLYIFWKCREDNNILFLEVEQLVKRDEIEMAIMACERKQGPVAIVLKTGLKACRDLGTEKDIDFAMQAEGNTQIKRMERGLSGLGIVVSIEPMLGFLGTIVGLIRAFMNWEKMGANVTVNVLAGGMYAAMITTAAGLIIAIPYFVVYNSFIRKTQNYAEEMDVVHTKLLQLLVPLLKTKNRSTDTIR